MTLILKGESRKSAAEQAMLNFFPPDTEGTLVSSLRRGPVWTTATARIERAGQTYYGMARTRTGERNENSRSDNARSDDYCIKESIYRAALPLLPDAPPWGSLTGIRPAKLTAALLEQGQTAAQTDSVLRRRYHVLPERRALALACARSALREKAALGERDIALYVGIPFCPSRCAYCSFVSTDVARSHGLLEPFTGLLLEEIALTGRAARELGLRAVTLYIGGGTPTVLSAEALRRVLEALHSAFGLEHCTEITVEAGRPDTITREKLDVLRVCGVTRVSINPQSLQDRVLQAIGRGHDAALARQAYALAREAGFAVLNADVIAGLPGDTPEGFAATLDELMEWRPENLTVHTLALKKGAAVMEWHGSEQNHARPGASPVGQMLDYAQARLYQAGYEPYYLYRQKFMAGGFENVGWSLPWVENRYNLCMMEELASVIAMGGGGVTKIVRGGRIDRLANCKFPLEYLQQRDKIKAKLDKMVSIYNRNPADVVED